jgi:hypothetical protein
MKILKSFFIYNIFCLVLMGQMSVPAIDFLPEKYVCYQSIKPIIMDGKLDDESWKKAEWTSHFIDIEGIQKPFFDTKAKMLWDEQYFYFGFELEETHLWASLTQRDTTIYFDNDIEIFIDPDGDTHNYYELEVNALGTEWDLFLTKPYRDPHMWAINEWDIKGLITKVHLEGTLNDPRDIDKKWTVEVAIPWKVIESKPFPKDGDQWRVNFSRVHWDRDVVEDHYQKQDKPAYNWVWSPQGLIAMHYPEMWGFVQFSDNEIGGQKSNFTWDRIEDAKWALRQVYYAQRNYKGKNGVFTKNLPALNLDMDKPSGFLWPPEIEATSSQFTAKLKENKSNRIVLIKEDGKVWIEKKGD